MSSEVVWVALQFKTFIHSFLSLYILDQMNTNLLILCSMLTENKMIRLVISKKVDIR